MFASAVMGQPSLPANRQCPLSVDADVMYSLPCMQLNPSLTYFTQPQHQNNSQHYITAGCSHAIQVGQINCCITFRCIPRGHSTLSLMLSLCDKNPTSRSQAQPTPACQAEHTDLDLAAKRNKRCRKHSLTPCNQKLGVHYKSTITSRPLSHTPASGITSTQHRHAAVLLPPLLEPLVPLNLHTPLHIQHTQLRQQQLNSSQRCPGDLCIASN